MALWYIVFTALFAGTDVLAAKKNGEAKGIPSCEELFKPAAIKENCCNAVIMTDEMTKNECLDNVQEEWTCKDSECFLKNLTKDGKIDEKKMADVLDRAEQQSVAVKPITTRIRKMCLGGGYEKIPSDDDCPATKMMACIYIGIVDCPSWKNTDTCKKVSEHAKTCKTVVDTMMDD